MPTLSVGEFRVHALDVVGKQLERDKSGSKQIAELMSEGIDVLDVGPVAPQSRGKLTGIIGSGKNRWRVVLSHDPCQVPPRGWRLTRVESGLGAAQPVVELASTWAMKDDGADGPTADDLYRLVWAAQTDYLKHHPANTFDVWPRRLNAEGVFTLHPEGRTLDELAQAGSGDLGEVCAAMSRRLSVLDLRYAAPQEMVVVPDDANFRVHLARYRLKFGATDWLLERAERQRGGQSPPVFARLRASWELWRDAPYQGGDADAVLGDLRFIWDRRRERETAIARAERLIRGDTPELAERVGVWKRVCDFQEIDNDVGLASISGGDGSYLVVPKDQAAFAEWVDNQEDYSEQGVDWSHRRLELRSGSSSDYASLSIQEVQADPTGVPKAFLASCDNDRGCRLADSFCDGGGEGAKLLLPDPQLKKIRAAIDLLAPEATQKSKTVPDSFAPSPLALRVLKAALTGSDELTPPNGDWPALPLEPLAKLSPAQERAVRAAIFGLDMTLIQGPPGTGKTTVILEILRQLFRRHRANPNFKVLLVAPTNVAIDNVLERLVVPRRGTSLVLELGVVPYRVGATKKIPEHLIGFTPDCTTTGHYGNLAAEVAEAAREAAASAELDGAVAGVMAEGARRDRAGWESALEGGELPSSDWRPEWPDGLPPEWAGLLDSQAGRAEGFRHWGSSADRAERKADLLERWHRHLDHSPEFYSELLLMNSNLVCATTIGCAARGVRDAVYDYVIVDEAGKEEARRLLVPLVRGERWVLVGDHRQLPPFADDKIERRIADAGLDPTVLTRSLFEELQEPFRRNGRYVFLDRQGRMHPDISAFVSRQFYGGELLDFPHTAGNSLPAPAFLPENPKLLVLDTRRLSGRYETFINKSYENRLEQEIIHHLLASFVALEGWEHQSSAGRSSDAFTVGVIAPYKPQVTRIKKRIGGDLKLNSLRARGFLSAGTVDSFQGQERDLVLFGCTRSNLRGMLGFVDNKQRLNVALSRARCRLIVILDGATVERSRPDAESEAEAETGRGLRALVTFAAERGGLLEVPNDWRRRWRG